MQLPALKALRDFTPSGCRVELAGAHVAIDSQMKSGMTPEASISSW